MASRMLLKNSIFLEERLLFFEKTNSIFNDSSFPSFSMIDTLYSFPANLPKLTKTLKEKKEIFDQSSTFKNRFSTLPKWISSSITWNHSPTKSHAISSQNFSSPRFRTIHIACAQRVSRLCPSPAVQRRKKGKRRRGGEGEGGGEKKERMKRVRKGS